MDGHDQSDLLFVIGRRYGNRFWRESAEIDIPHLHSVYCRYTTDGKITTWIQMLTSPMTPLRLIKIW